jgi:threonine/homoserine/homoserine lactone efflux protein
MIVDNGRWLAFALTAMVLVATPGPGVLFIVSRGVSLGRRAALATVFGHFCGLMVQVAFVAAGVGAIVQQSLVVFSILKLVGACYLVFLGVQAFRKRHALAARIAERHESMPVRRIVRDGFVVGVSNPKGFAIFASVLPPFTDPRLGHVPLQIVVLGLTCGAIALVSDSIWGLAAGTARTWLARSPRRLAAIGGTGGLVTVGLGLRLAATGRHD